MNCIGVDKNLHVINIRVDVELADNFIVCVQYISVPLFQKNTSPFYILPF